MALRNLEREMDLVLRHVTVLQVLSQKGPIGIRRISSETGIPRHQVRYSLRVLERAGVLVPTSRGAKLTGKVGEYIQNLVADLEELDNRLSGIVKMAHGLAPGA